MAAGKAVACEFFGTPTFLDFRHQKELCLLKGGTEMDKANIDYILYVFKTLSTELPEQMLYREDGESIELRTLDSIGSSLAQELQNNGWSLIGSAMTEAA